jgi:Arc/MetJ family transcription regulator
MTTSLLLTGEELMLRAAVRAYAERELAAHAAENDQAARHHLCMRKDSRMA